MPDNKDFLTREEFVHFKNNEFFHLERQVDKISSRLAFIQGQLFIIIPASLAILGVLLKLILEK